MKKHAKSEKAAKATAKKLAAISAELDEVLKKHKITGIRVTGIELRAEGGAAAASAAPPPGLKGCVVLPDGSIWCG